MTFHNLRIHTHTVQVGNIPVGGGHPIVIQSMTNTDTEDASSTTTQILDLAHAGSELVRITVNTEKAAKAVPRIVEQLAKKNCFVPIIGDFHYNGHKLLSKFPECAESLSKYRINPGNVGRGEKRDEQFATMIETACKFQKPIRIGVNWGSLDQSLLARLMNENARLTNPKSSTEMMKSALITSALDSARQAEDIGLAPDKIILSCKVSKVQDLIEVYQSLSSQCHYPLHLGLTEAGMGTKGVVATTAALSVLLQQGIGDTIRASLTPSPGGNRTQEVIVSQEILQSMGIRSFTPMVVACPGCGRTSSTYFQSLAESIQEFLRTNMPVWRERYPGVETMTVAVMGCVVNGPGESKHANIGISLPGTGENPVAPVYIEGKRETTLKGNNIADEFQDLIMKYISRRYQRSAR